MREKDKDLLRQYEELMTGFTPPYRSSEWPMENGVYKQYSAFDSANTSIGGTSYFL